MAANSILRVDIVGGGPVGLAAAICILKLLMGMVRIRVFDTRWNATGNTVEWKGIEAGNNRRTQVVTIQSNVYSLLPREAREAMFVDGQFWEIWPYGPDSPEEQGRPRNMRISWIEEALLQTVRTMGGIELIAGPYPMNPDEMDVLVIADGRGSRTLRQLQEHFGAPDPSCYSLDGKQYVEQVLGVEVQSDLVPEHTVPITVSQNWGLFNPDGNSRGFINFRLPPGEALEVVGVGANSFIQCIQRQPCVMRPHGSMFTCPTHNATFKPSLDPTSFLWPRIQDGLKLFGVPSRAVLGITMFRLGMERTPQFVSQIAPGKFAMLVGDAGNALHFWPGRGLNTGFKSAVAASRTIRRLTPGRLRDADVSYFEGFMQGLQHREKSRAWTTMRMPRPDGTPYLIHERIDAALQSTTPRNAVKEQLVDRIASIASRLAPRMGKLPGSEWYSDRLVGLNDETLRILLETGPWITADVGGREVNPDDFQL